MNRFTRNEWLGIGLGTLLGFWLCLVLIWAWPPLEQHHQHEANQSPEGHGSYHEIDKTSGEWLSAIWERTSEDPVALYTLVLSVFTALLGFATVRLWFVTSELVDGAEDTARRQLRAYLGVVDAHIEIAHGRISVAMHIKNFSPTPAYQFRYGLSYQISSIPSLRPADLDFTDAQWDMSPQAQTTMRASTLVNMAEIQAILMSVVTVTICGRATYADAFGHPRFIEFTYRASDFRKEVRPLDPALTGSNGYTAYVCFQPEPIQYESN